MDRTTAGTWETSASRRNVGNAASWKERKIKLDSAGKQERAQKRPSKVESSSRNKFKSQLETGAPCRRNVVSCGYARPFDRMPVDETYVHISME